MAIQLIPDIVQLGGNNQPGLWATGVVYFGDPPDKNTIYDIDLTSEEIDPRISYNGPSHYYWSKRGILEKSANNVWPLEYLNGIPVGRHEPEPAATNYQGASQCDVLPGLDYIVDGYSNQVTTTGPNGRPTILLPETWNQCGLHSSGWLVPLFAPEAKTGRIVLKSKITSSNSVRIYLAWRDPSGKIATIGQKTPAGNITASFFRTYQTDGIGCGLIQVETGSLATSLIDTASGKTASRASSSVVINTSNARNINVCYSDGKSDNYNTPDKTFSLPFAAMDWGDRFITRIKMQ